MDMMAIPNRVRVFAVMLALALAGGLFSLVLLAKHTQAKPPTDNEKGAVVQNFPVGGSIDTSGRPYGCVDGELIDITGTGRAITHFVPVQGGYHVNNTFLLNGRGVGQTTGDEYVISSTSHVVENFLPTGDTVTSNFDIQVDIGKGSSPDRVVLAQFHYILTEDGVVKGELYQSFVQCPGSETVPPTASASAAATTP